MIERRLIILGAGGHGKVVADAALCAGFEWVAFADSNPLLLGQEVFGCPVVATDAASIARESGRSRASVVVAVGDNHLRARAFQELNDLCVPMGTLVHPAAILSRSSVLGRGTVVLAGAIVGPDSKIDENVILNTAVRVDHDTLVAPHVHLSPGVCMGGDVRIGEGAHLGVGVGVRNRISIGAWSVIGVGAAVVGDVPAHVVAYGVPARIIRATRQCEISVR